MKGTTFKRCGCRDPATGPATRTAPRAPACAAAGGGWSRSHGHWHWQIELPAREPTAPAARLRHGTYPSQADADTVLDRIRAALAVPDPADTASLRQAGDLIEAAVKADADRARPPTRSAARCTWTSPRRSCPPSREYLTGGSPAVRHQGRHPRSYEGHIRLYLIPYLGAWRIDRLRPGHIDAMYDAIDERNARIAHAAGQPGPRRNGTRSKGNGSSAAGHPAPHPRHPPQSAQRRDAPPQVTSTQPGPDGGTAAGQATQAHRVDRRTGHRVARHRQDPQPGHGVDPATHRRLPRPHPRRRRPALRPLPPHRLHRAAPRRSVRPALGRPRPRRRHPDRAVADSSNTAGPPPSTPPRPTTAKPPSPSTTETVAVLRAHRARQRRERLAAGARLDHTPGWCSPPPPAGSCTRPTSPTTSTTWPPKPACRRSGCTTCAMAPPPWAWPPAYR